MTVRVCVECGEEYRPGIAVCADCGGALEDRDENAVASGGAGGASGDDVGDADEEVLTASVLHAERASLLTGAADRLAAEKVAFLIRPGAHNVGYDLRVADDDRERALDILGLRGVEGRAGECPACSTPLVADAVECPECGLTVGDEPEDDPGEDPSPA